MEYENIIKYSSVLGILLSLYALFFLPYGSNGYWFSGLFSQSYTLALLVMFLLTFFYMYFNSENKERYYKFALICFGLYLILIFASFTSALLYLDLSIMYLIIALVTLVEIVMVYRLYAKKYDNEKNTVYIIIGLELIRALMFMFAFDIGFFFSIYVIITIIAIGVACLYHEEYSIDYDTASINIDEVLADVSRYDSEESVRALAKQNIKDESVLTKSTASSSSSSSKSSSSSAKSSSRSSGLFSGSYTGKKNYAREFKNYWENNNFPQSILVYKNWDDDEEAEKDFNYMCATIAVNGLLDNLKVEGAKNFLTLAELMNISSELELFPRGDKTLNDWFLRLAKATTTVAERKS